MATLIQALLSQNHWGDLDGVQTVWNFTFQGGYIERSHVKAYYINQAGTLVNVTVTDGMFIGPNQLSITPAIPATAQKFVIYRDTPKITPIVNYEDGANVSEVSLDTSNKQAIFGIAESIDANTVTQQTVLLETDGVSIEDLGFKALRSQTYTGSSAVSAIDNGRGHLKTDSSSVSVPATLPLSFLGTIINWGVSPLTITFAGGQIAYLQGNAVPTSGTVFTLPAKQSATINQVLSGSWMIAGLVTRVS